MPFSISNQPDGQILRLEGPVTIRHAQELGAQLREGLEDGKSVSVDTADLTDMDTCILQLLCSLRKTVADLSFDHPSDVFLTALDRCGLRRELLTAREVL